MQTRLSPESTAWPLRLHKYGAGHYRADIRLQSLQDAKERAGVNMRRPDFANALHKVPRSILHSFW